MAFGGIETGLRALGIPDPSKIALGIQREYDFNRVAELSPDRKLDPETIKNLESRGLFVCTFAGLSPLEINNMAQRGSSRVEVQILEEEAELLTLRSKLIQVAFDPTTLFLPESDNLTLSQQMERLSDFSHLVQQEMPQVRAMNGSMPDWIEAIYRYVSTTGRRIFSKRHRHMYTATSTISKKGLVVDIGGVIKKNSVFSIDVNRHNSEEPLKNVSLAPMFVPASFII